MFAAGRMVLRVFLGSHGTLVAVSAPFMMPLRDSDIPMNVPFTFSNKQPLHRQDGFCHAQGPIRMADGTIRLIGDTISISEADDNGFGGAYSGGILLCVFG
jgi:hypothetical protein